MTHSVQNREKMIMLAEMRSHGSAWNERKGERASQLRRSPRRGMKQSPLNQSRELVRIYFDQDDQKKILSPVHTDVRNAGTVAIAHRSLLNTDLIGDKATKTFGYFSKTQGAAAQTTVQSNNTTVSASISKPQMSQGRQALMNQIQHKRVLNPYNPLPSSRGQESQENNFDSNSNIQTQRSVHTQAMHLRQG